MNDRLGLKKETNSITVLINLTRLNDMLALKTNKAFFKHP